MIYEDVTRNQVANMTFVEYLKFVEEFHKRRELALAK